MHVWRRLHAFLIFGRPVRHALPPRVDDRFSSAGSWYFLRGKCITISVAMKPDRFVKDAASIAAPYRISKGKHFRLKDCNPADTGTIRSKALANKLLEVGNELLCTMQDKLYAQNKWALLLIFQAMDAAGKDGAIKHVMSGVNPQGCDVSSFKKPSAEELDHDYLWRAHKSVPGRGKIGIFNRSYYEEVLVVRVHRGLLKPEGLPEQLIGKEVWNRRYKEINDFENYLS